MPHWCLNGLEVTGPEDDVQAFSVKAAGEERTYGTSGGARSSFLSFHQLVPLPAHILAGPYNGQNPEAKMWGVSGGAHHPRILAREEGRITYAFETVGIPPLTLLKHVSQDFPTLTFQLAFAEPCKDVRGLISVRQGQVVTESLPYLASPPEEEEYGDEVAFEEALEAYFTSYDDHVWDLVRPEPR